MVNDKLNGRNTYLSGILSRVLLYLFRGNFLTNSSKVKLKPPGISTQQYQHWRGRGKLSWLFSMGNLGRGRHAEGGRIKMHAQYEMTLLWVSPKFSEINTHKMLQSSNFLGDRGMVKELSLTFSLMKKKRCQQTGNRSTPKDRAREEMAQNLRNSGSCVGRLIGTRVRHGIGVKAKFNLAPEWILR